jgi:hypothetical protein
MTKVCKRNYFLNKLFIMEIIMSIKTKSTLLMVTTAMTVALISTQAISAEVMLSTGGYATEFQQMEMMKMIDANGDHKVTKKEYDTYYGELFNELDTDKSGSVDSTEWKGPSSKSKLDLATGGYTRELRNMEMMGMMDKDGDHNVTKEEFLAYHDAVFSKMDTTQANELTAQEWGAKGLLSK